MSADNPIKNFPLEETQKLLNMGLWDWDLKSNEILFSGKMLEILGLAKDKPYKIKDFLKIILNEDRDRFKEDLYEFIKSQETFIIEFRLTKNNVIHQVSLSGTPIFDDFQKAVRVVGFGQDISDNKSLFAFIQSNVNSLKRTQRIANIGIWEWDNIHKEFVCDEAMYSLFEVDSNQFDLTLKNVRSFFSPIEWKKCLLYIRKHMRLKKDGWFEQKIFSGDGKQKEIAVFFEFEITEQGKIKSIHGIVQDVSQQKIDREKLNYRVEFERMVSAISSNFINLKSARIDAGINLALDIIGNFMNVNRSYLFLFSENNTIAKLSYQWHSEAVESYGDDQQSFLINLFPLIFGTICSGQTLYIEDVNQLGYDCIYEREYLLNKGANSVIWVPLSLEGKVIGGLGFDSGQVLKSWSEDELSLLRICGEVFVNALSRKNYELDLKRNEEHLSIVVDSIGDAVIALDAKNKIIRVNIAAELLTGYQLNEIIGKQIEDILQYRDKAEKNISSDIVSKILELNTIGNTNDLWNIITKDRRVLPISINGAPLKGVNIGVIGTVLVCREMTNQIKLEEQLRHSEKMRAIGQLSGGIAHDFNNLLTGIIGCANYLKKHLGPNEHLQEYVENILITGRRAATLTSQLLAFSRQEKPRLSEIDIHFLISEVINLLVHTIDPRIRMHKNFKSPLSILEGDESQLHNAILNLAVNARDAMPSGGDMIFSTEMEAFTDNTCIDEFSSLKPGIYIVLSIKDSGYGISKELMSHIFEPFFTTKEKGKGTGLGLAAVYGTVMAHHGCIAVQSELSKFTEFKMYLPLLNKQKGLIIKNQDQVASTQQNKKRILVVDDEILLCTLACETLTDSGYIALAAYNGLEALNIYKTEFKNIDLVLVDMLMPNMNGPELLDKMFALNPFLKAIIVSGFTGNLELNEMIKSKKIPFLQKPYEENNLLKLIEQALNI